MKFLYVALLLFSEVLIAGNVQSLRTDSDGTIIAKVRGEKSRTVPFFEEDTWDPNVASGTNTTGSVFTYSDASYQAIGSKVYFSFHLSGLSVTAAASLSNFSFDAPIPMKANTSIAFGSCHMGTGASFDDVGTVIDASGGNDIVMLCAIRPADTGAQQFTVVGHYTFK